MDYQEEERIWGVLTARTPRTRPNKAGRFAPMTPDQWRQVFLQWAIEYAYYYSLQPQPKPELPIVHHKPVLDDQDCIEMVLAIVGSVRHDGPLDLWDPLLYTVWLDFLCDHEVRWLHWQSWQRNKGELRFL